MLHTMKQLKELLPEMIRRCKVVSFDNLAIDQLNVKDTLFKDLLIEYSAFNQTNAQVDLFKEKQYKELFIKCIQ